MGAHFQNCYLQSIALRKVCVNIQWSQPWQSGTKCSRWSWETRFTTWVSSSRWTCPRKPLQVESGRRCRGRRKVIWCDTAPAPASASPVTHAHLVQRQSCTSAATTQKIEYMFSSTELEKSWEEVTPQCGPTQNKRVKDILALTGGDIWNDRSTSAQCAVCTVSLSRNRTSWDLS